MEKTHGRRQTAPRESELEGAGTRSRVKAGIGLAALGLLVLFLLQNLQEATIRFLWFEWTTGTVWALLLAALFGAITAMVLTTMRSRRQP